MYIYYIKIALTSRNRLDSTKVVLSLAVELQEKHLLIYWFIDWVLEILI